MVKSSQTPRSPRPSTVACDHVKFIALALLLAIAFYTQQHLAWRQQQDWSEPKRRDSVGWQALEGILMGFRGSPAMLQALEQLQTNHLLQGKTVLVTGGNRGLGKAIAARLLCLGANVIVTSRTVSPATTAAVLEAAAALPSCQPTEDRLHMVPLDLADLHSVAAAARAIPSHLHVVILNAGLAPQEGATTAQGFELAFGVNCIGHYALVRHLVAQGVFGAPHDRLVVITSESARAAAPLDMSDLFAPATFGMMEGMTYYARSKLAVNTVTTWLTQALEPRQVQVHSICPGPVATDIARQTPIYFRVIVDALMKLFFQTADQASWPVLALAALPEFGTTTGRYLHMYQEKLPRRDATNADTAQMLVNAVDDRIRDHLPVEPL